MRHADFRKTDKAWAALVAAVTITLLHAAHCFAGNPFIGTWTFDDEKSEMHSGVSRNASVTYSQVGDKIKVVTDGQNADGTRKHSVWLGKFDGESYRVEGNPCRFLRRHRNPHN
jgi:hypothetical protein